MRALYAKERLLRYDKTYEDRRNCSNNFRALSTQNRRATDATVIECLKGCETAVPITKMTATPVKVRDLQIFHSGCAIITNSFETRSSLNSTVAELLRQAKGLELRPNLGREER